jgi:hypothetical protein
MLADGFHPGKRTAGLGERPVSLRVLLLVCAQLVAKVRVWALAADSFPPTGGKRTRPGVSELGAQHDAR